MPLCRAPLLATNALLIERLSGTLDAPEVYSPGRQIIFTERGCFRWQVGRRGQVVDANRLMFVEAGEASRDVQLSPGEVSAVVFTPSPEAAAALFRAAAPFRARTSLASNGLQAALARLAAPGGAGDDAAREEDALALLGRAVDEASGGALAPRAAARSLAARSLAARAKEYLAGSGEIVPLTAVARALSVSPAHLTDAFRRAEGVSLVRYQQKLRLARALIELRHADDVTALALELGFSSHSHFTTAFRAAMGVTPSAYRRGVRAAERS